MKKLVLALAAIALIATPALADSTFYGSARIATFYTTVDEANVPATDDLKKFNVELQGNSRFGMKASTGDVSGRVEMGTAVNLRLLYGEVKLGAGTLLLGQTYTPYTKFSNQAYGEDLGFIGFGAMYDGRQPQIKYTMDNGLYFAVIKNGGVGDKMYADVLKGTGVTVTTNETLIPKLNVGFAGKAGNVNYNVGVAYQTAEGAIDDGVTTELDDFSSYFAYLCGDAKFGEVGLIYGLHYGTNLSNFGILSRNSYYTGDDATSFGGLLEVDVKGFGFGVGYVADELDVLGAETDAQMSAFVQYTYQVAKGFKIVPEITYIDLLDDAFGADEGTVLAVGAKWQMDF